MSESQKKPSVRSRAVLSALYRPLRAQIELTRRLLNQTQAEDLRRELERELADHIALCHEIGLALCRSGGRPRRKTFPLTGLVFPSPVVLRRRMERLRRKTSLLIRSFPKLPCSHRAMSLTRRALETLDTALNRRKQP